MDVAQFQDFLGQLVSLQAQGLDAQHLLDEAKKAGKEEAAKEAASAEPVQSEVPAMEVPVSDKVYSEVEFAEKLALALSEQKAEIKAKLAAVDKSEDDAVEAIFA